MESKRNTDVSSKICVGGLSSLYLIIDYITTASPFFAAALVTTSNIVHLNADLRSTVRDSG